MMHEEHFLGKVAQKAILTHEKKILLTCDPRTPDTWELPGGRLNVDEEPQEGLKRELFEELGVQCTVHEVVHMCQFWQGTESGNRALAIVYRATIDQSKDLAPNPTEISKWRWFNEEEVRQLNIFPEYSQALKIFFDMGSK